MKVLENSYYPETTGKEISWGSCFKLIYFVHELEHHVCFRQIMVENLATLLFTSRMMCVQAKLEITRGRELWSLSSTQYMGDRQ